MRKPRLAQQIVANMCVRCVREPDWKIHTAAQL